MHNWLSNANAHNANQTDQSGDAPNTLTEQTKTLPCTDAPKNPQYWSITCNTLVRLLNGEFSGERSTYFIIDCRFPYEFEGGHIRGAINISTTEEVERFFIESEKYKDYDKIFIVFHCEFSSQRGPALYDHLRGVDRHAHYYQYPLLYYPELYLLEGGYSAFFQGYPDHCEPRAYIPMKHEQFADQCKDELKRSRTLRKSQHRSASFSGNANSWGRSVSTSDIPPPTTTSTSHQSIFTTLSKTDSSIDLFAQPNPEDYNCFLGLTNTSKPEESDFMDSGGESPKTLLKKSGKGLKPMKVLGKKEVHGTAEEQLYKDRLKSSRARMKKTRSAEVDSLNPRSPGIEHLQSHSSHKPVNLRASIRAHSGPVFKGSMSPQPVGQTQVIAEDEISLTKCSLIPKFYNMEPQTTVTTPYPIVSPSGLELPISNSPISSQSSSPILQSAFPDINLPDAEEDTEEEVSDADKAKGYESDQSPLSAFAQLSVASNPSSPTSPLMRRKSRLPLEHQRHPLYQNKVLSNSVPSNIYSRSKQSALEQTAASTMVITPSLAGSVGSAIPRSSPPSPNSGGFFLTQNYSLNNSEPAVSPRIKDKEKYRDRDRIRDRVKDEEAEEGWIREREREREKRTKIRSPRHDREKSLSKQQFPSAPIMPSVNEKENWPQNRSEFFQSMGWGSADQPRRVEFSFSNSLPSLPVPSSLATSQPTALKEDVQMMDQDEKPTGFHFDTISSYSSSSSVSLQSTPSTSPATSHSPSRSLANFFQHPPSQSPPRPNDTFGNRFYGAGSMSSPSLMERKSNSFTFQLPSSSSPSQDS